MWLTVLKALSPESVAFLLMEAGEDSLDCKKVYQNAETETALWRGG